MSRYTAMAISIYTFLGVVGWAAVDAFGALHGMGIVCAVWLLMPQVKA